MGQVDRVGITRVLEGFLCVSLKPVSPIWKSWSAGKLKPTLLGTTSQSTAAGKPSPLSKVAQTQRYSLHSSTPWDQALTGTERHPCLASPTFPVFLIPLLISAGRT